MGLLVGFWVGVVCDILSNCVPYNQEVLVLDALLLSCMYKVREARLAGGKYHVYIHAYLCSTLVTHDKRHHRAQYAGKHNLFSRCSPEGQLA